MNVPGNIAYPAISAFSLSLFHSLWQFMLVAVVWRILLFFLKGSTGRVRYHISLITLLATPLIFIVTFLRVRSFYAHPGETGNGGPIYGLLQTSYDVLPPAGQALSGRIIIETFGQYGTIVFLVYFSILLVLLLRTISGFTRLSYIRRNNILPLPGYLETRISELLQDTGLKTGIPVFLSARVSIPMVTGFFKPVVLLPAAIFSSLSVKEVDAILLHEFRHIKLMDHHMNLLVNLIETLFFYHPAIRSLCGQIRLERESRVDEWVVASTGDPLVYANALVNLESRRNPAAVIAAAGSKNQLFSRIKKIMDMKPKNNRLPKTVIIIPVILMAALSAAWLNPGIINDDPYYGYSEFVPAAEEQQHGSTVQLHASAMQQDTINREELRRELEHAREELRETLRNINSESFRLEMEQARNQSEKEMENIDTAAIHEELRRELERAREELRETLRDINSERFRMEMEQAREQLEKAMENIDAAAIREQIRNQMQDTAFMKIDSEQLRRQMEKAGADIKRAMQGIDTEKFRQQMERALEQMEKAMEDMKSRIRE